MSVGISEPFFFLSKTKKPITTPKTHYVANIYITDIHGLNTSKQRGGRGRGGGVWMTPFLAEMKCEQPTKRKK